MGFKLIAASNIWIQKLYGVNLHEKIGPLVCVQYRSSATTNELLRTKCDLVAILFFLIHRLIVLTLLPSPVDQTLD